MFIGQPLWKINGYNKTIKTIYSNIESNFNNFKFIYRVHPKEDINYIKSFKKEFTNLDIDISKNNIHSIFAADIILSCFSNTGIDIIKLSRVTSAILAIKVYVLFEKDIMSYYKGISGLSVLPPSNFRLSLTIKDQKNILQMLQHGLEKKNKELMKMKINKEIKIVNSYDIMLKSILAISKEKSN